MATAMNKPFIIIRATYLSLYSISFQQLLFKIYYFFINTIYNEGPNPRNLKNCRIFLAFVLI